MLKAYLAGAIRGPEDYVWRQAFRTLYGSRLQCLIPADIGVKAEKLRYFSGSALMTYKTDLALIETADLVIVNLTALDEDYRCIGTLFELGYAAAKNKHILILCSKATKDHPFIAFGASGVFTDWEELHAYLRKYITVIAGQVEIHQPISIVKGKR